jgi:hypothetical protein
VSSLDSLVDSMSHIMMVDHPGVSVHKIWTCVSCSHEEATLDSMEVVSLEASNDVF